MQSNRFVEEAMNTYLDTVFRMACSILNSSATADDVTQDVFIKLYRHDGTFDSETHLRSAFMMGYAINGVGQSYGSLAEADNYSEMPDLISGVATNGKEGYVYREELAAAENAAFSEETTSSTFVTVYAEDGKTPIGEFEVSGV